MAPEVGNQYWRLRSRHGPKRKFATADELAVKCDEYLQWVEDNPLQEEVLFHFKGVIVKGTKKKMRAMTLRELCLFLNIDYDTWKDWRNTREDLKPVLDRVGDIIWTQKFTGAAADLLNGNIIARQLSLVDKSEVSGAMTVNIGNKDAAGL